MKSILAICLLAAGFVVADEKAAVTRNVQRTQAALTALDQKLQLDFSTAFPKELDIDLYLTQPLARLTTTQGELFCTKPVVNPFDGDGTVEWHLGPPDTKQFSREHVYCFFSFDDRGDILHVGILSDGGWFCGSNEETHQIIREDGEAPATFLSRAFLEYHRRAVSSSDSQKAVLYLSGVERITQAVCELRKAKETPPAYPATARP